MLRVVCRRKCGRSHRPELNAVRQRPRLVWPVTEATVAVQRFAKAQERFGSSKRLHEQPVNSQRQSHRVS